MANKKLQYVKSSTVDKILKSCDWLLILGERSNGKSYASKNLIIKKCIDNEEEAIEAMKYNRNYKMVFSNTDITIFELIDKDRGRANNGK